jgi:hypothetical protein
LSSVAEITTKYRMLLDDRTELVNDQQNVRTTSGNKAIKNAISVIDEHLSDMRIRTYILVEGGNQHQGEIMPVVDRRNNDYVIWQSEHEPDNYDWISFNDAKEISIDFESLKINQD